ncbi:DEAD/DEAH box helicase [Rhizobium sp. NZLR1]|uniref:DEAD/DEAH box helicase n=1 Tax=Rhizobium sp. NZLR1 TaxID=2731096 RepID=UPI001A98ED1E|nr:DEAD/DEAH box helicase [Rhizobium sp. NZLR1]MBX5206105.1 DEAD/DEAH box helicase [Rhizobium sp. NZLR1]QSZ21523.1 DEAD/DEAH box helicase [Rhizobium sp. NZLR1]
MTFQLLRHQHEGVGFLIERGVGLLAFEQGLGKTFVAIEAFRRLHDEGRADKLLVICPNSLKRNWVAELAKFAPVLSVAVAEGTPKQRRSTFQQSRARVIVTSYETSRSETTALLALAQRQRTVLVLDESHAAKNWRSLTSTAARTIAPFCEFRWLLSGTPVTNTATDLFTQVEIIEPGRGLLGSLESFTAQLEEDPAASFAKDVIDRLVLRRTKDQCLDLPQKSFVDIRIEMQPWQRRLYDEMRDEMVCEIEAMSGEQYRAFAPTALAKLTRLIQLASNPCLVFPELERSPAKFEALDGIIADIMSVPNRKVILWSNYIRSIESLLARIQGSVAIYGGTPPSERQEIAARFQNDPNVRVLIANPAAAGTGFTLTAANYTIYESLSWRYDHYAQSQDRNHRIGQTQPVTYLRLLASDTIEEAIVSALERKSALARSLLGDEGTGDAIAQLTKAEMCLLLKTNRLPEK